VADPQNTPSPIFSIVIPTMNRPEFLETTLKTALWQTFPDFEVVVSDNSNQEEMREWNQDIVRTQGGRNVPRYVRPDRWLNMPDHFEFASLQARGRYVLILTDRRVLMPHALEYLNARILSTAPGVELVSWYDHWGYSDLSGMVTGGPFGGGEEVWMPMDLAADFARFEQWKEGGYWSFRLPHILNGCYRSDLAQRVRGIHGRLFMPVSPDFTACFLMLAYGSQVLYIDRPLSLQHAGRFLGNGSTSFLEGVENYTKSFPEADPYEGMPVPLNTLFNTLARDFLKVRSIVGGKFAAIEPNWAGYYVTNYLEILDKENLGSGMDLGALYSLWEKGLSLLPPGDQAQVRETVRGFHKRRASFLPLRKWMRKKGWVPYYSILAGKVRRLRQRMAGGPVYDSIFEAAVHTDLPPVDPGPRAPKG
jgi:hypothetical protein